MILLLLKILKEGIHKNYTLHTDNRDPFLYETLKRTNTFLFYGIQIRLGM